MKYKTLSKICLAISGFSIIYMFLIAYEGTAFGWIIFLVFLGFGILFNKLDENEKDIENMRSTKNSDSEEDTQVIFHRKNPIKSENDESNSKLQN